MKGRVSKNNMIDSEKVAEKVGRFLKTDYLPWKVSLTFAFVKYFTEYTFRLPIL